MGNGTTSHEIPEGVKNNLIAMIDHLEIGLIALDADEVVRFVNTAAVKYLELDRELLLGKRFYLNLPLGRTVEQKLSRANPGHVHTYEFQKIRIPWGDSDGYIVRVQNITEEVRAESFESSLLYEALFDRVQDGVFLIQEDKFVFTNPAFADLLGYRVDEIIGRKYIEVLAPEDRDRVVDNHRRRMRGENVPQKYEITLLHKDGHTKKHAILNVTLFEHKGEPTSLGSVRDVTSLKQSHERVRWNEALLRAMATNNPMAFYVVDSRSNKILYFNHLFCEIWNIEHLADQMVTGELTDKDILPYLLIAIENRDSFQRTHAQINTESNRDTIDDTLQLKDGRSIRRISTQIRGDNDKYFGRLYMFEDISKRVQTEKELRHAKEKAEESEHLKDSFIGNMSHEIRTPLNIIMGYTDLIKTEIDPDIDSDHARMFNAISTAGSRLVRTIEHIMNISSIEAGTFPLHKVEVDPIEFVGLTAQRFKDKAEEKGLSYSYSPPKEAVCISIDKYCLEQALSNVIDNAVKFTQRGSVAISIRAGESDVTIKINDTGIGIGSEYLPRLYERFSQEEEGMQRSFEGLGLGMALTRYYVEANHGRLEIWSEKTKGTTVTMTFPRVDVPRSETPHKQQESAAAEESTTEKAGILAVEDDETTQRFLKLLLGKRYNLHIAASAEAGQKILESHPIDLILMDISIKGDIDGIRFTRRLKLDANYSHIPIIATTAHAHADTRLKSLEAGCDEFLIKPLDVENLPNLIDHYLELSNETVE
ncbi:MAG: hypothetical protein CL946_00830 [Ectothiorhodospiraceae bacterium]|nr:hypothetical protein [Ectothiorhodospiraceae bacterium]